MSDENFDRIERQLEGNSLALNAIAEVLQKMDSKLSREEGVALAKQERIAKAREKEGMVQDVANSVLAMIKAEFGRPAKGTGKTEKNADDSESQSKLPAAGTEAVQKPIVMKEYDDDDEEEEEMEKAHTPEHDDEEDGEDMEKSSLKAQIAKLQKQLSDYDEKIEKAVKEESEARLRKMGFREEKSLQAPTRIEPVMGTQSLGVDEAPYISKSNAPVNSEDVVEQLASLSFKQLRDMQEKIEAGDTNGIPRELLGE